MKNPSRVMFITGMCMLNLVGLQFAACQQQSSDKGKVAKASQISYVAGKDYTEYQWARIWDRQGFERPIEAFSLLIPKGWTLKGEIIWNAPGNECAGTNAWLNAQSADGSTSLQILPNTIWNWSTNPQMQQFHQSQPVSECAPFRQPMDAEPYLRNVMVREIGSPQVIEVTPNSEVVALISQGNEEGRQELMSYGASQVNFYPTALTATVKWANGDKGIVLLGVNIVESIVPNIYNGTFSKSYTSSIGNRTVFRYPGSQEPWAKAQMTAILASIRTNTTWKDGIDGFWKQVRHQKQVVHVGKIALMDRQTREMGDRAIAKGNANLKDMDQNMRSWEAKQTSLDKMQTNFIKTIREVENYRDETGKVELSSGYSHAWSRGDGGSFIMTDNPNFDPSSVLNDQRWKEMRKVD